MTSIEKFNSLLKLAVQHSASDIHLKTNRGPIFRINGKLKAVETNPFNAQQMLDIVDSILPEQFKVRWREQMQIDFSHEVPTVGRFRINAFFQRTTPSIVMRHIKEKIPSFADINLDLNVFETLCKIENGIALICGATGSGKSTTLAAMIRQINESIDKHIITLEDPIEFSHRDIKSLINQREIGIDAPSFGLGIVAAMRQDPDIILVGEMRDAETFSTALRAAETGHIVFGTLARFFIPTSGSAVV
jgi:twitching motility protein PilT